MENEAIIDVNRHFKIMKDGEWEYQRCPKNLKFCGFHCPKCFIIDKTPDNFKTLSLCGVKYILK